jgi:hypothetical protein
VGEEKPIVGSVRLQDGKRNLFVFIVTTDNIIIAPEPKAGTVFTMKSIPRIGESIRVKEKRYRIKDIEHTLDHPQGHHLTLVVESEREVGDVI